MRVQVAEQKAEEGHLGYRVVKRGSVRPQGVDDAGAAPPPPETVGQPTAAAGRRLQALHAHPLPEPVATHPAHVGQLQHPGQVAQHRHPKRRQGPHRQRREHAGAGEPEHVVDQTQESGPEHCRYGGDGQVVRFVGGDARESRQHGRHVVAAVVVGDAVPGQPLIFRRETVGVGDGIEDAEVHGLFRVVDCGHLADHQRPKSEQRDKGQLDRGDHCPATADKIGQLHPLPVT